MKKILIINGPNLNLIGSRQQETYGQTPFTEILEELKDFSSKNDIALDYFQSNIEGEIIDKIHSSLKTKDFIIINPGALTHYSYSIYDALLAVKIPVLEVHITNIFAREQWRQKSVVSQAVLGVLSGLGTDVYIVALMYIARYFKKNDISQKK